MKRGYKSNSFNKRNKKKNNRNTVTAKSPVSFWDQEYLDHEYLALSTEPAEDLLKFIRWLKRTFTREFPLKMGKSVTDIGCGNGRNINFIAATQHMRGVGFDISHQAIEVAKKQKEEIQKNSTVVNVDYMVHSIQELPYPVDSESQTLVLDMMASHVLNDDERKAMYQEVRRMLVPGGWYFYKTFLLDGDLNAERMITENPGPTPNSYVHPHIGHVEYVMDEEQLIQDLEDAGFYVHKVYKSHKHLINGRAAKRRTVSVYCQK